MEFLVQATMSMPMWFYLLTYITVIDCAPKLGPVLFDPLSYEAVKDNEKASLLHNASTTSTPEDLYLTHANDLFITPVPETIDGTNTPQSEINTANEVDTSGNNNLKDTSGKLSDIFNIKQNVWEGLKLLNLLRNGNSDPTTDPKTPCSEYEYNGTICKVINNRLLCGYDKNTGDLKNDETVDMGNGCRMHQGRIECGYLVGPFNEPRRPPASDDVNTYDDVNDKQIKEQA